jgi:hypothetical protein
VRDRALPAVGVSLCLLLRLAWCPTAAAQTPVFATEPAWSSGPINNTFGIALGDVDGDGGLDLACSNSDQWNTLYDSDGELLSTSPVWHSDVEEPDGRVTLGDVDADGDLDLICVATYQRKKIYFNDNGVLSTTPKWESGSTGLAECSALGDVNNDGYPDLVCGSHGGEGSPNELYLSNHGVFPPEPDWVSEPANPTWKVALGDIDGNGFLDLVCANDRGISSTLYLNHDGIFETNPAWTSVSGVGSWSVALGDLDGDGDLDAVFGNRSITGGGAANTAYRNQGGLFEPEPYWSSAIAERTMGVALGDVDGDGDLDLVCGNYGEPASLYLNHEGTLSLDPNWTSSRSDATQEVALGDVDGDGDLDLVCGNQGQSNTIYLNQSPPLASLPFWRSVPEDPTLGVALADVDGDGDLDLACANSGAKNTLYRNDGRTLAGDPDWTSAPVNPTNAVTFADMDGDGDPDLVCGNLLRESVWYQNVEGTLETDPFWSSEGRSRTRAVAVADVYGDGAADLALGNLSEPDVLYRNGSSSPDWSSGPAHATSDLAWADVDGDGDQDLVCGNGSTSQPNTMYENLGGTLGVDPAWASDVAGDTRGVALGDLDADGDPDLVCANYNQGGALYRNGEGVLSENPVWSTESPFASEDVALADLDGNGYLDLVFANHGEPNTVFLNRGGTPDGVPFWQTDLAENSRSVSAGDLDGDGDLDLVFGNQWESNSAYGGIQAPVFRHDPTSPTHQLPNNGAHLRSLSVAPPEIDHPNRRQVRFTAIDVESDPLYLSPEYRFRGSPARYPVEAEGGPGRIGPFESSPTGVAGSFEWDLERMPLDPRSVILRVRVIEVPRRVSLIQHVAPYVHEVGPITPRRPVIDVATAQLVLPTVSLGDTVSLDFSIQNRGNEPLVISSIGLPSSEMSTVPAPPFEIPVNGSTEVRLVLAPREVLVASGVLAIRSNDPISPEVQRDVQADIRDLTFRTVLLSGTERLPLGEAVTVEVRPDPEVRLESVTLFHRTAGVGGSFSEIQFVVLEGDFIGVIPGEGVTERGLEYFVEVENSEVVRRYPAGAPEEVLSAPVAPPSLAATFPRPNAGTEFLEHLGITVQIDLPRGTEFLDGLLFYRRGGEAVYDSTSIERSELLLEGALPDSLVTFRGVEYWVRVATATRVLTDPAIDPRAQPRQIQVTVRDLVETAVHPGGRYRMVSLPLQFGPEFAGTLASFLSDQTEFQSSAGAFDPTVWRSYRYLEGENVEISRTAGPEFRPEPGRSFWLISRSAHQVDSTPIAGVSTPTEQAWKIELQPGWNQIGDPFAFAVPWDRVVRSEAIGDPVAFDPWAGSMGEYLDEPPGVLSPFEGYFVFNESGEVEILSVPPVEAPSNPARRAEAALSGDLPPISGWTLTLSAAGTEGRKGKVVIGVLPGAMDGWDPADRRTPPEPPGNGVRLSIDHADRAAHPGSFRRDLRCPGSNGYRWNLDLWTTRPAEAVVLEGWNGLRLPADLQIAVLDLEQGVRAALNRDRYPLVSYGPDRPYRLTVIAGDESYVNHEGASIVPHPVALVFDANAPNPFCSATRLRFGLPAPSEVSLEIYNVHGERVAVLIDGEKLPGGYHTAVWDLRRGNDALVSSGVYFGRLTAAGRSLSRRIVCLR